MPRKTDAKEAEVSRKGGVPWQEGCQGRRGAKEGGVPRKEGCQGRMGAKEGRVPRKEECQGRRGAKEGWVLRKRGAREGGVLRRGCDLRVSAMTIGTNLSFSPPTHSVQCQEISTHWHLNIKNNVTMIEE